MARMTPWADRALRLASRLSGVSGAVAVVALAVTLVVVGWPVLESAGHYQFFSGTGWFPQWTAFDEPAIYGSLSFLFGTLMTAFLGLVAAFPLAFATGLWLGASAGPRQRRFAIEWLGFASTWPALAFGACGLLLVAPVLSKFFGLPRQGYALAGIVLALMHLPSMALRIAFALRDVPDTLRDDAALLGATGWQVLWRLVIPAAWPGIATAIVLAAIGLAGEAAAVRLVVGTGASLDPSPFGSGNTLASAQLWAVQEHTDAAHRPAMFALATLLVLITTFLQAGAWRSNRSPSLAERPDGSILPSIRLPGLHRFWLAVAGFVAILATSAAFFGPVVLGVLSLRDGWSRSLADALIGSVALSGSALFVALPAGFLAAHWLAPSPQSPWARAVQRSADWLRSVPSCAIGLVVGAWVLGGYEPVPRGAETVLSGAGLAAWLALSLLLWPTVLQAATDALRSVSPAAVESCRALGASRWQTLMRVQLPAAWRLILWGAVLAFGRGLGETAAMVLTAGVAEGGPLSWRGATPYLAGFAFHRLDDSNATPVRLAEASEALAVLLLLWTGTYVAGRFIARPRWWLPG